MNLNQRMIESYQPFMAGEKMGTENEQSNQRLSPDSLARRRLLCAGTLGTVAVALGAGSATGVAKAEETGSAPQVPSDGKYAVVALRKENLQVTAVQSFMRGVRNLKKPEPEMQANVEHMIEHIDSANGFYGPQDLVCFHEQPIMGWNPWTREEALRVAIDVPGPETEALGKKAKQYGCYISFGTYAKDPDWPGHLLLNGILIAPDGNVVANHWKTNNGRGFLPGWDIYTTSINDVLDQYREMYGEDAVLPIARTDIGNISCSVTPGQPDVMRALAMKGLEIRLSSSSGGYNVSEAELMSQYNQLWSVVCNPSVSREHPGFPEFSGSGDTTIFSPRGIAARAKSVHEEFVKATLPVASFRQSRTIPTAVPMQMLLPVYKQYVPRYGPNLQADYIPTDSADASRYFASKRNW